MRFQFYDADLETVPKLSVDGIVENSIHLSHWQGNQTPNELRADTSTEIALNFVSAPNRSDLAKGIDLVTNNHFDTDGILSVWTVLNGERALDLRDKLIPAAEAGDFSEFRNEDAVRASIVIQGADQAATENDTASPLARQLAGDRLLDDALCYDLILPHVERVLTRTNEFEPLWREGWDQLAAAIESFERGRSTCEELDDAKLSLIILDADAFRPAGFSPTHHAAPYTAISRYARGHLFLIAIPVAGGWYYRIDYPYYSWAETVVRPRIKRLDLKPALDHLNQIEPLGAGSWKIDKSEMTSAAKFLRVEGVLGVSKLSPEVVAQALSAQSTERVGQMRTTS